MTRFYSKTTGGFYDDAINGTMPEDVLEISDEIYQACFDGQSVGKAIKADVDGYPVAVNRPPLPERQSLVLQIQNLENEITARRRDEAILGMDGGWLAAKRAVISALRASIPPL